jgi:hypothetical protein
MKFKPLIKFKRHRICVAFGSKSSGEALANVLIESQCTRGKNLAVAVRFRESFWIAIGTWWSNRRGSCRYIFMEAVVCPLGGENAAHLLLGLVAAAPLVGRQ